MDKVELSLMRQSTAVSRDEVPTENFTIFFFSPDHDGREQRKKLALLNAQLLIAIFDSIMFQGCSKLKDIIRDDCEILFRFHVKVKNCKN